MSPLCHDLSGFILSSLVSIFSLLSSSSCLHITYCHSYRLHMLSLMIHSASLIFSYSFCRPLDLIRYTVITITLPLDVLVSMTHKISYAYGIPHMRAGLTIGYLSLVSLHFVYLLTLSLHYGLCRKTTLRPWNQTFSLTASIWIGICDFVDI